MSSLLLRHLGPTSYQFSPTWPIFSSPASITSLKVCIGRIREEGSFYRAGYVRAESKFSDPIATDLTLIPLSFPAATHRQTNSTASSTPPRTSRRTSTPPPAASTRRRRPRRARQRHPRRRGRGQAAPLPAHFPVLFWLRLGRRRGSAAVAMASDGRVERIASTIRVSTTLGCSLARSLRSDLVGAHWRRRRVAIYVGSPCSSIHGFVLSLSYPPGFRRDRVAAGRRWCGVLTCIKGSSRCKLNRTAASTELFSIIGCWLRK
jgi:hypothetical protein